MTWHICYCVVNARSDRSGEKRCDAAFTYVSHMILVYLNSKKVSIMRLLQRVHSETKVSYDSVIYNKSQCVHRA